MDLEPSGDAASTSGASAETVDELTRLAIQFHTDDPRGGSADLEQIGGLLQDARIIGLGEGTHGTREFFRTKHRLLKLVTGFHRHVVFAIEANMADARAVDQYIRMGIGDVCEAVKALHYWTWVTEEMTDMVQWMHDYNQSGAGTIRFFGFDMSMPVTALTQLRAFLERTDPELLARTRDSPLWALVLTTRLLTTLAPGEVDGWLLAAQGLVRQMAARRRSYLTTIDSDELDWVIQIAVTVAQAGEMRAGTVSRERSMAQNVEWIERRTPSGTPLVLWGHNCHIQRAGGSMGDYLACRYGEDYQAVGFLYGDGEYTAVGARGVHPHPTHPPIPDSTEAALRRTRIPRLAVDLRALRRELRPSWFSESRPYRSIGAVASDSNETRGRLDELFDLLVYVDKTTATKLIRPKRGSPART